MRTPAEDVGHHAAAGTLLDPPKPAGALLAAHARPPSASHHAPAGTLPAPPKPAGALLGAHVRPPFVRMQDPVRRPGDRCYEGGVDGGGGQGSDFFFRCASTVLVEKI